MLKKSLPSPGCEFTHHNLQMSKRVVTNSGFSLYCSSALRNVISWTAGSAVERVALNQRILQAEEAGRKKDLDLTLDKNFTIIYASGVRHLREESIADYAVVNLGMGEEWLTSRLFIMAIVFARMKGVESFVFLETLGNSRKRYVGWAEPERIRWTLARRYSWLEQAFADAYSTIISQQLGFIVSDEGRLGSGYSPQDPGPSIELLKEFLQRVQLPHPVAPKTGC